MWAWSVYHLSADLRLEARGNDVPGDPCNAYIFSAYTALPRLGGSRVSPISRRNLWSLLTWRYRRIEWLHSLGSFAAVASFQGTKQWTIVFNEIIIYVFGEIGN